MTSNIAMFSDLARAMTTTNGGHRLLLNHQQINVDLLNSPVVVKFVLDDRVLKSGNIQATLEFSLEFNFTKDDSGRICAIEMRSGGSLAEPIIINFVNWRAGAPVVFVEPPFITTDDVTLLNIASGGEVSFDMNVNGVHGDTGVIVDLNLWYKDPSYVKPEPIKTVPEEQSTSDVVATATATVADPTTSPDFQDLDEPPVESLSDPIDFSEVSEISDGEPEPPTNEVPTE